MLAALLAIAYLSYHTYLFTTALLLGVAWIITWALEWRDPTILHRHWPIGVLLLLPPLITWLFSYVKHRRAVKGTEAAGTT